MARTLVQAAGLFKLLKFVLALSFNFGDGKEGVNNFPIKPSTTRGLLIDAGSGGSRLHIYQWAPRIFKSIPGEISYPTTNERMTGKITPGVANIVTFEGIRNHLEPLIDFARVTLVGLESEFAGFPIHFKATGGMRELPLKQRELIMENVRILLSDKSFCPFYFVHEMARVISGEEEAVYSWVAVNFLFGKILTPESGLISAQTQLTQDENTFGTLDLGGASTQIAFFVPTQDILESMFKVQFGGRVHWNVYTKSFLSFGHNSARLRHVTGIADASISSLVPHSAEVPVSIDYCFHSGYSEWAKGSKSERLVQIYGPPVPAQDQFERCVAAVRPLLVKYNNAYCDIVYNGQCSINGAYQPVLPNQRFIGTSSYNFPWQILQLPETATLDQYRTKAEHICSLSFSQVIFYYETNSLNTVDDKLSEMIPEYCFLSSYVYVLLMEGYGFTHNHSITVLNRVNGNDMSWPLGAIMHEINTMPWELETPHSTHNWEKYFMGGCIGLVVGAAAAYFMTRELFEEKLRGASVSMDEMSDIEGEGEVDGKAHAGDVELEPVHWSTKITQYNPFNAKQYEYTEICEGTA